MQVLLLEDEPEVGRRLLSCLNKWNMNGHLAQNDEEALAVLKESSIDLLITDLVLPKMTGVEVVRQLRQTPRYENLPVLMISGRAQKQDIVKAAELGINGFIAKPFKAAELKKKILEAYRAQRQRNDHQQIERIWSGRLDLMEAATGPLVIFGEPLTSAEQLRQPVNRRLVSYLGCACEIIAEYNADNSELRASYIIENDTTSIMVHLKRHASRKWVRLVLLSTQCGGNPALIARLFTINHRDDIPLFLVYSQAEDITPIHRKGLKQLGIRIIKRDTLDKSKTRQLIGRYIIDAPETATTSEDEDALTPQQVHGRILDDLEAMKSLPPLPQVYEKISALARDPNSHLRDWIKIIKVDPMTCATILRHADSLSYGFTGEVTEIDRAVILLGKNTVEGLVASEAVRQSFTAIEERRFILENFWMHNMAVGFAAYILSLPPGEDASGDEKTAQFAALGLDEETVDLLPQIDLPKRVNLTKESPFVGGIMHDIGKAVMAHSYPAFFRCCWPN